MTTARFLYVIVALIGAVLLVAGTLELGAILADPGGL